MSFLRDNLIDAYRWLTNSARDSVIESFSKENCWPAGVLFYHRVANTLPNEWSIATKNFVEHLDLIQKLATITTLEKIVESQKHPHRSRLEIAITFDDGYAENIECAILELIRRNIPCTYFVTTDNVEKQIPFTHDLDRNEPHPVNSIAELKWMASRGIEIGGHSASHIDLGQMLDRRSLIREISDSRKKLQDWTGQEIPFFAFPYGLVQNMSQAAIDMVFESGYRAFLSAYGGWNFPGGDSLHISRIHGEPGTASLLNWLTLDPRKIYRKCPFQYSQGSRSASHGIPIEILQGFSTEINTPIYYP